MHRLCCRGPEVLAATRGSVTAETAVILPALIVVLFVFLWAIGVAVAHMQCVDAARAAARAVARGEELADARAAARQAAPEGADVALSTTTEMVDATVTARLQGPGPLLSRFALTVQGKAVAATEAVPREQSASVVEFETEAP